MVRHDGRAGNDFTYKEFFNEPGEVITWIVGINVLLYAASILLDSSEALSMKNGLLGFVLPQAARYTYWA